MNSDTMSVACTSPVVRSPSCAGRLRRGSRRRARAAAPLKVVTTTEDLAALAREVGGDRVTVTALAKGYQDPHFRSIRSPASSSTLSHADLLIAVGRELEIGWLPSLMTSSRNAKVQPGGPGYLDASLTVKILEIPTGQITRAMGDVHPQGNPHYWLDPGNGRLMARAIRDKLTRSRRPTAPYFDAALRAISTSVSRPRKSDGTPRWRRTRARSS